MELNETVVNGAKWRGKIKDDDLCANKYKPSDKWVEGFVYIEKFGSNRYKAYIYNWDSHYYSNDNTFGNLGAPKATEVCAETLGRCTGLTDINGNLVFEGDILQCLKVDITVIVSWDDKGKRFIIDDTSDDFLVMDIQDLKYFKVIGNIYDNLELLEQNKT